MMPATVAETAALLAGQGYVADRDLATTIHLALSMGRPLLLEGEPGTGKTEIAKVLAAGLGSVADWCGCNAMTGWIWPPPPMNGTMPAS